MPLVVAFLALAGGPAQRAMAANSPLFWSGPMLVDPNTRTPSPIVMPGPPSCGNSLCDLSCPSTSLCVAMDGQGNVLTTTDPAVGNSWTITYLGGEANWEGSGVSCTSAPLCVGITEGRSIVTSTEPTGGPGAWSRTEVDSNASIGAVSCVSETLCVAVDKRGNVLTSANPTGGVSAWRSTDIDGELELNDVSCASSTLCVAVDERGNVLISTDPTRGAGTWSSTNVAGSARLFSASCVPGLCVAGSIGGVFVSTDPTGGAGTWVRAEGVDASGGISCSSISLCVAIPRDTNAGVWVSTDPMGGTNSWIRGEGPEGGGMLGSVSCASTSLCVIGDLVGRVGIGIQTHTLSTSLLGTGLGTVTSTPIKCPFVNCSHIVPGVIEPQPIVGVACADIFGLALGPWGPCSLGYPAGNEVTLTATPSAGSVFAGWGGACSGSSSCTLAMTSDQSVSATFAPRQASPITPPIATAPILTAVKESAKRWREGRALARISSGWGRLPVGTTFSFSLNEPASVTFTFVKKDNGHKGARTCGPRARKDNERRCTRASVAGILKLPARMGPNQMSFEGYVSRHKKLPSGDYTLLISARSAGQRSKASTLLFTIASG
jgi:hypothetical protein